MYVCALCACASAVCACATIQVWESEDNLLYCSPLTPFMGPGDQAEVTRLMWFVPLPAESFHDLV